MSKVDTAGLVEIFRNARAKRADIVRPENYWGPGVSGYSPVSNTGMRTLYGRPSTFGEYAGSITSGLIPGSGLFADKAQYGLGDMAAAGMLAGVGTRGLQNYATLAGLTGHSPFDIRRVLSDTRGTAADFFRNNAYPARVLAERQLEGAGGLPVGGQPNKSVRIVNRTQGALLAQPVVTVPPGEAAERLVDTVQSGTGSRVHAETTAAKNLVDKATGAPRVATTPPIYPNRSLLFGNWRNPSHSPLLSSRLGRYGPAIAAATPFVLGMGSNVMSRQGGRTETTGRTPPTPEALAIMGITPDVAKKELPATVNR